MAAVLVITRDKVQIEKVAVDQPRFVIGRSSGCDLTLPDNMLSRQHCVITDEGGYKIQDNGSRNGTELNGSLVAEATPLSDGDKITVGPFEMTFYSSGGEGLASLPAVEEDAATRFVGSGDIDRVKDAASQQKEVAEGAIVKVAVTTGPLKGSVYKEWLGDLRIGRGSDNDVMLPDEAVSNAHARIFRDKGQYWIEDFGSSNGTFVDNVRITQRQALENGQKIRIGAAVMQYTAVDPVQLRKRRRLILITATAVIVVVALAKVFQPEDKAAKYLAQGQYLLKQGDFEKSIVLFNQVLEESPGDQAAKQGISQANSQREAADFLKQAQQAALEERYADAEDICYRVLRLHPKHEAATELLAVVKMVEESQVAVDAQNWMAAIGLMEKALETYTESELLQEGLARATSELAAKTHLDEAQALVDAKQFSAARNLLTGVEEESAYFAPTQEILEKIVGLEKAESAFMAALEAYRNKNEEGAMKLINQGLAASPGYPDLERLRNDIELVVPLAKSIKGAEALLQSDDVAAIRQMVQSCEAVTSSRIESEEVSRVKSQAADLMEKLQARLLAIASDAMSKGKQALADNNFREALQHFNRSAQANPANEAALEAAKALRKRLVPLIKEHFQQALVHEELEQFDLAVEEYEEVLNIAVQGEDEVGRYYGRAKARLKRLEN